jgi:hypothetical protein
MVKSHKNLRRSGLLLACMFLMMAGGMNACTPNEPSNQRLGTPDFNHRQVDPTNNSQNNPPTYSGNGGYDDNGVEPAPNNDNQNFGHRW